MKTRNFFEPCSDRRDKHSHKQGTSPTQAALGALLLPLRQVTVQRPSVLNLVLVYGKHSNGLLLLKIVTRTPGAV